MKRPVCLITGATGALGPSVVAALSRTHEIRTLSRHPPPAGLFPETVDVFTGDIADRTAVRRAAGGAQVIVHLAALLHVANPEPRMRSEYERVNVGGTATVVEAALSEEVGRVVVLSTIAVYGYGAGSILNEDSTPRPDTLYGETKLAAERVALDARRADGAPLATVLRSAAVYGPRVKGNYRALVDAIARRRFVPIGRGENRRTLVFEDDLASAIALVAEHPAAVGRTYNVSDGRVHTLHEIIVAIAAGLGRRPPAWSVPVAPVRLAAMAGGLLNPRIPRMLDKYLEDVAVEATRIQKEIGFRPRFTLERGWAAAIRQMRNGDGLVAVS
jgi:nucleoside-diphosphate-sugar epimerase